MLACVFVCVYVCVRACVCGECGRAPWIVYVYLWKCVSPVALNGSASSLSVHPYPNALSPPLPTRTAQASKLEDVVQVLKTAPELPPYGPLLFSEVVRASKTMEVCSACSVLVGV